MGVEVLLPVQGQVLLFDEINIAYRLVRTPPQPQGNTSSTGECMVNQVGVGIPPPGSCLHGRGRKREGAGETSASEHAARSLLLLVVWQAWGIRRLMRRWWRRPGPTRHAWPSHDHHHHKKMGQHGRR